jgi:hypothetical protein
VHTELLFEPYTRRILHYTKRTHCLACKDMLRSLGILIFLGFYCINLNEDKDRSENNNTIGTNTLTVLSWFTSRMNIFIIYHCVQNQEMAKLNKQLHVICEACGIS